MTSLRKDKYFLQQIPNSKHLVRIKIDNSSGALKGGMFANKTRWIKRDVIAWIFIVIDEGGRKHMSLMICGKRKLQQVF